jgi:hypothetical protein
MHLCKSQFYTLNQRRSLLTFNVCIVYDRYIDLCTDVVCSVAVLTLFIWNFVTTLDVEACLISRMNTLSLVLISLRSGQSYLETPAKRHICVISYSQMVSPCVHCVRSWRWFRDYWFLTSPQTLIVGQSKLQYQVLGEGM